MENYTRIIGATSTNIAVPTVPQINQGNDSLTPYDSAKNNGYYKEMSQAINNVSTEVVNVIIAAGLTPGASLTQLRDALLSSTFSNPIGSVIQVASTTVPTGYVECNGAAISRSTYSALFAAIGTVFGSGDGSTTFNAPDLRGYFVRGWDHGRGIDAGRAFGSNQSHAAELHRHAKGEDITNETPSGTYNVSGQTINGVAYGSGNQSGGGGFASNTSSVQVPAVNAGTVNVANENRPYNVALMYCIKY